MTPADLERDWGLAGGHILHGELALDQLSRCGRCSAGASTARQSTACGSCGSGTHPGPGLTGGSGANAAREMLRALK